METPNPSTSGPTGPGTARFQELVRKSLLETQRLANIGSWVRDLTTGETYWSDEQIRLLGEDPGNCELTYENYLTHLTPADQEITKAQLEEAMAGKGEYYFEHELHWRDGTVLFVAEKGRVDFGPDGKPMRLYGITQDITERKRYEAALQAKQRELEIQTGFLQSIVDNIPVAVFIKDIRKDFRVTLWNKAAEGIFQVKREEILGKTAHDLWPKEQADSYLEADRTTVRENRMVEIREEPSQTKDRGTILLHTIKLPLRLSESEEPEFLLVLCNDVTREKRVKAELRAAKESAERANRAKSEFLAMMSHEIRTPMNGVLGMAQLLLSTPLTREQSEMIATLKHSGGILLSVINDVLDYSKIEAGQMEVEARPFSVEAAVREVAEMLRPEAGKKSLRLSVTLHPAALSALGDAGRIRQVLTNLIGNAIKFTHAGEVSIRVSRDGDSARVDVTDTGIGIAEESRDRIFRMFSQADASTTRRFGGTGLGLAISKRLMEMMGGRLDFSSEPGKGSTFFLTLPLASAAPSAHADAQARKPNVAENESPLAGLRVLLAEDNVINRKVGMRILDSLGCHVDAAANGKEAVEKAKAYPYDLILMDIRMPEMDGLEAAREIRKWEAACATLPAGQHQRLPIIALSAGVMQDDRELSLQAGMDDFLSKPIMTQELCKALAAIVRKAKG
jgi:PAS domain S-box-containing protein